MWCATCHQDVPLSRDSAATGSQCARCGNRLDESATTAMDPCAAYLNEEDGPDTVPFGSPPETPAIDAVELDRLFVAPPLPTEDWQFEAEFRDVDRLVNRLRQVVPPKQHASSAAHVPAAYHPLDVDRVPSVMTRLQAVGSSASAARPTEKSNFAAWSLLSLGLATFVCGGVLLGWAFAADRGDLWSLGLPLTLAGQAGLILGLVMQLEGLWRSTRQTDQTLNELDGQLSELRHATTMLGSTHSSPAQSFYAHMAEGANPQLLMADLKGQLDLLAQQLAAHQRRSA